MTPGGSEVFRHTDADGPQDLPDLDLGLRHAIQAHLARFLPGEPDVMGEIISTGIQLDLLVWAPTDERPLWTIVTMGMSERPMNVPDGLEELSRLELVMTLPPDWPMPSNAEELGELFADARIYWPIRLLKDVARLPSTYNAWLFSGHTIMAGEDEEAYPGTEFAGALVDAATSLPPEFMHVEHGETKVWFLGLYPLHRDELEFKLNMGRDELFTKLYDAGYSEGVFPGRPSVV